LSYKEFDVGKTKISVTIDESVVKQVDRLAGDDSRSEIVERALRRWLVDSRRKHNEEAIAAYYADRSEEDRLEDEAWAAVGARHLESTWK
jgi:metal-responsive CopG/Arc/MetJ family transcriptional regulator